MSKVLILYYSTYGHVEKLAAAVAAGAREAGATVDIKRVPETAPEAVAKAAHFKLDQAQGSIARDNVVGIANRVRQGDRFPALIAVQCAGNADVVLVEGHTRATAYALTGLPDEVEVLIGTSAHMANWAFF